MIPLGKYLLGILAGTLICGIAMELIGKKGGNATLLRLLCGVFMPLCVVSPLLDIRIGALDDLTGQIRREANAAAQEGKNMAQDYYRSVITQRTEAYILDKALSCKSTLEVDIILSEDEVPVPSAVRLEGYVSPYAKRILQQWLVADMGIPKERQIWIG